MDRPTRPVLTDQEVEEEYIRATLAAEPRQTDTPPAVDDQGFAVNENGEPIRYVLDPPSFFLVHYTKLAEYQLFWLRLPGWDVVYSHLPDLLAQGHDGKFAVVQNEDVTVVDTALDALLECDRRGGPHVARYYPIREQYSVGRRHPRLRRCPDTSSKSPKPAS